MACPRQLCAALSHYRGLIAALAATATLVAGCGDDDGGGGSLEGLYDITQYTQVSGGCEGSGVDIPDAEVLSIVRDDFLGASVLQGFVCPSVDGCGSGDGFADWTFAERRGSTWISETSVSSPGEEDCLLSFNASTMDAVEGGVRLVNTFSSGSFPLTGEACNPDAVDSRRDELTCNQIRQLDATTRAE